MSAPKSAIATDRAAIARSNFKGILWAVAASLCFVAVTGIVRHVGTNMHPSQAAFLRYLFAFIFLAPVFFQLRAADFAPYRLARHGIRGIAHGLGVALWFYAMTRLPVAEVTALSFTSPLFVTIGAALFLGEKLRFRRVSAVLIGFIGTIIIVRPTAGLHLVDIGVVAQLVAAPLFACSMLLAKDMTKNESPTAIVAFMGIFVTLTLAPLGIYHWQTPTLIELVWLGATAGFATLGHICLTRGFALAELSVTQPISFVQLLWASLLGFFVFSEVPEITTWIGGGIIVASATYIAHREARLGRQAIKQEQKS